MKRVVIAGGTGFIGSYLVRRFRENGYEVLIVSREAGHVSWNDNELKHALDGAELVVNLAGKNINCRHNVTNRRSIIESRVNSTLSIGNALLLCDHAPKLWINASAAGVYKSSESHVMTENETELGKDFLSDVVREWESTFFGFQLGQTRQVALRTSVVLGKNGGAFRELVKLSRIGLGGKQGNGKQIFSWIHIEDYFRVLMFLLNNNTLNGVVNCTSPGPVSNRELMFTFRKKLHVSVGIPAPKLFIHLAARVIGTEPGLILSSSFIGPKCLQDAGFYFYFPSIELAISDLLRY